MMTSHDEQQLLNALDLDLTLIDRLIASGLYATRADVLRAAIARLASDGAASPLNDSPDSVVRAAPLLGLHLAPGSQVTIKVNGMAIIHTGQAG